MKEIKVYGPGCSRCSATAKMIEETAASLGVEINVEKVTDMTELARHGILSTPGVTIDGKVVHAGGLPKPEAINGWLRS
ncbi:MAG: thioredoxin family protein [Hyphomicrobium sp.]|jgi:small redox-active disulfide protein 2|nr:thioredoxin family protein [Hyphomicrobium sp.]